MGISSTVSAFSPVRSAMTLVAVREFTAQSSVSLDGVFTSAFENYRVVVSLSSSVTTILALRPRAAGVDNTANWTWDYLRFNSGAVSGGQSTYAAARLTANETGTSRVVGTAELFGPAVVGFTSFTFTHETNNGHGHCGGTHTVSAAYDGFTLYPGAGTITGTVYVYGYAKSLSQSGVVAVAGGGTAGLVKIVSQVFSGSAVVLNNCFSEQYKNYRVVARMSGTAAAEHRVRLRAAGADLSTASTYRWAFVSSGGLVTNQTTDYWRGGYFNAASAESILVGEIMDPASAVVTMATWSSLRQDGQNEHFAGWQTAAQIVDGFTLYPQSGSITGYVSVYGYVD